jgi:hypothetical protein
LPSDQRKIDDDAGTGLLDGLRRTGRANNGLRRRLRSTAKTRTFDVFRAVSLVTRRLRAAHHRTVREPSKRALFPSPLTVRHRSAALAQTAPHRRGVRILLGHVATRVLRPRFRARSVASAGKTRL